MIVISCRSLLTVAAEASTLAVRPTTLRFSRHAIITHRCEMLKSPVFWVMYVMFVMVAAGGLMATAQLAPIAKDFKIADVPVSLLGITLPALTFALSLDRILNGVTRPFFGWVSDKIGREQTMFIAFGIEGVGISRCGKYGHDPVHVRAADRPRVLRVGRNLQPLPGDVRRHVRLEVRDGQCRSSLHGEGHGLAARAVLERPDAIDGKLARGILRGGGHEYPGGSSRALRFEADARAGFAEAVTRL